MTGVRAALIGLGCLVTAYGGFVLVTRQDGDALVAAATWLVVGVVLHDAVLVPLVLATGWLAARRLPDRWRRPATVAVVVLGPLTLLAVPVLGRFGAREDNPTLLDRPYVVAWLALVAATAAVVVAVGFVRGRVRQEVSDGARAGRR